VAEVARRIVATPVLSAVTWRARRLDERTRHATASLRLRPTFLVIGAQKAGTTSLHGYLTAHPAVLGAWIKDVQYFSKFYGRGEDWYLAYFPLELRGGATRLRSAARRPRVRHDDT
jgi:hypothetical protein